MISKKWTLTVLVLLALMLAAVTPLMAQGYPTRGIELVIPWPPGGATDITCRIYANELSKILKVPVTPVNKSGASGTIGATYVHKSKKDGYTLFSGTLGWLLSSITFKDVLYDPQKDFIPITKVAESPHWIVVKNDSPIKSLEQLIDMAKKNPMTLSVGTSGTSSDGHFNIEILQKAAGMHIKHVPFTGGSELPPAILGGHIDAAIGIASSWLQFVKAGNIRVLATTGNSRMKELPGVLTLNEKGFKENFLVNWSGIMVSTGTPENVVSTLARASEKVIKDKAYAERVENTGSVVEFMTPADFTKMIASDRKVTELIANELGLKK
jgi:tripartite-type tricarboxylate transporter receptor subunit TctC